MEGVKQGVLKSRGLKISPDKVYTECTVQCQNRSHICGVGTDSNSRRLLPQIFRPAAYHTMPTCLPCHCAHHRHRHLLSHSKHHKVLKGLTSKYVCPSLPARFCRSRNLKGSTMSEMIRFDEGRASSMWSAWWGAGLAWAPELDLI